MCLAERRSPVMHAKEDIVVYKLFRKSDSHLYPLYAYPKRGGVFRSDPIKLWEYENIEVPIYEKRKEANINVGYYCFSDRKDAINYRYWLCAYTQFTEKSLVIYRFIIPKGAKYRKGFQGVLYACPKLNSLLLASKLCNGRKVRENRK